VVVVMRYISGHAYHVLGAILSVPLVTSIIFCSQKTTPNICLPYSMCNNKI